MWPFFLDDWIENSGWYFGGDFMNSHVRFIYDGNWCFLHYYAKTHKTLNTQNFMVADVALEYI